jgi:hypothetical protein
MKWILCLDAQPINLINTLRDPWRYCVASRLLVRLDSEIQTTPEGDV